MSTRSNTMTSSNTRKFCLLAVAVAVVAPVLLFKSYFFPSGSGGTSSVGTIQDSKQGVSSGMNEKELLAGAIPQKYLSEQEGVKIEEKFLEVKGYRVFYREVKPLHGSAPSQQVLLLHGQAFTSENWENLGTLSLLGALGHRAIAVDLPGYGKSPSSNLVRDGSIAAAFILELIEALKLGTPVIISPSMSGMFSLPFLTSHPDRVRGYVPVAPGYTEQYKDQYPLIKVPTVIVVGDRDKALGPASVANLRLLPNHVVIRLPNARHPAYLDQPKMWHRILYNFLRGF